MLAGFPCGNPNEGESAMRKLGILIGGALALAACARTPTPPVDLNNPLMAPGFLAQAGSANEFEIESSQLALQSSQNAAVRNFANVMISDHGQMGQQVAAAAVAARLQPPTATLLPAQQAALDQLRASGTGYGFDMAYQQAQIQAHQQAIQLMQNYATSGDVPTLRTTAGGAIPIMQRHLAMAQALVVTPPPPPPPPAPPPPPVRRSGERG
jgi:putative membrane protein